MKMLCIGDTGLKVSALCYGLGSFGTTVGGDEAYALYDTFRQAGGNFFDTAHCYAFWVEGGLGVSERTLGECLRRRGDVGKVVIATKGGHPDAGEKYRRPDSFLAPTVISADITDSLDRLGLGCIDLYLLHRDDSRVPVGEIIDALNGEIARGRIRNLGASNWTTARIAQANQYAASHGRCGFAISQPQFNLAVPNAPAPTQDPAMRFLWPADVAWHGASKLPVMAYSSTAGGYFATGGKTAQGSFDNAASRGRLERARQLAQELGCTVNQVALAYLMNQDFPVIPILGTTRAGHLADAFGAMDIQLTPRQVGWLANDA